MKNYTQTTIAFCSKSHMFLMSRWVSTAAAIVSGCGRRRRRVVVVRRRMAARVTVGVTVRVAGRRVAQGLSVGASHARAAIATTTTKARRWATAASWQEGWKRNKTGKQKVLASTQQHTHNTKKQKKKKKNPFHGIFGAEQVLSQLTIATTASQGLQSRRNILLGFAEHVDEITGTASIAASEECVRSASSGSTGSTTDAVHVILNVVGEVVVDDKANVLDIFFVVVVVVEKVEAGARGQGD